mgnify:CR=1 FL=1
MDQEKLEELVRLSKEGHKCPNDNCCEYEKYNQCFNHAHVLCPMFDELYRERKVYKE